MKETTIQDIERINVIILIIGSLASILIMQEFKYLFSFAVASAIMTLNFRYLRKVIEGGFGRASVSKKDLMIKLPLKFLVLVGLVAVVMIYGDINLVFFLIGLSTVFFSIVVSQFSHLVSPAAKRRQNNGA
jgi:Bacterial ATP synthase I.